MQQVASVGEVNSVRGKVQDCRLDIWVPVSVRAEDLVFPGVSRRREFLLMSASDPVSASDLVSAAAPLSLASASDLASASGLLQDTAWANRQDRGLV
jgi:hypothetical protein